MAARTDHARSSAVRNSVDAKERALEVTPVAHIVIGVGHPAAKGKGKATVSMPGRGNPAAAANPGDVGKQDPSVVHYRIADQPTQSCGTCANFIPGGPGGGGSCQLVAGPIDPTFVCDLWTAPGGAPTGPGQPLPGTAPVLSPLPGQSQ